MIHFFRVQILQIFLCTFCLFCNSKVLANNQYTTFYIDKSIIGFPEVDYFNSKTTFHLVSHGRPGELFISGHWLNAIQIGSFLEKNLPNSTHSINIYGCEFGKGIIGLQAVNYLEQLLGKKIYASDNITGQGGDWVLEIGNKIIKCAVLNNYGSNLQYADNEDFDGDAILNGVDLDDDNDGIPDIEEQSCTQTLLTNSYTITTDLPTTIAFTNSAFQDDNYSTTAGQITSNSNITGKYIQFDFAAPLIINDIQVFTQNTGRPLFAEDGGSFFQIQGWDGTKWVNITDTLYEYGALQNVTRNGTSTWLDDFSFHNTNAFSKYRFWGISGVSGPSVLLKEIDFLGPASCVDKNTDTDGIADRFDRDSDGDGCSDAYEAGLTTDQTPNYFFTGSVGSNGLLDALETTPGSGDIKYPLTKYINWALNSAEKLCLKPLEGTCSWSKYSNMVAIDPGNEAGPPSGTWYHSTGAPYTCSSCTYVDLNGSTDNSVTNLNSRNSGGLFDLLNGPLDNEEKGVRCLFDNVDASLGAIVYDFGSAGLCAGTYQFSMDGRARGKCGNYLIFLFDKAKSTIDADTVFLATGTISSLPISNEVPSYKTITGNFVIPAAQDMHQFRLVIAIFNGGSACDHLWDRIAIRPVSSCQCIPLPVQLTNFAGSSSACDLQFSWKVADEKSFSHYELQKSDDGTNFETIQSFKGSKILNYTASLRATRDGMQYFRLFMVDLDGHGEYSNVIPIRTSSCNHQISIFPSPTTGEINIEGMNSDEEVNVYNGFGSLINRFGNKSKIDISDLAPGVYFVIVNDDGAIIARERIIKQ